MKFTRIQFKRKQKAAKRDLAQVQAEALTNMGAHLSQLRQDRALTIEAIARKTLIPARLLRAIEAGDLDKLPEPVYVQGFLRRFADTVGLDGQSYARDFPTGNGVPQSSGNWTNSPLSQIRPLHLYLLYISLVVLSVRGLSSSVERPTPTPADLPDPPTAATREPDPETVSTPVPEVTPPEPSPQTMTANAPQTTPQTDEAEQSRDRRQPVRVGITLTDESWIEVVADGEVAFAGMLSEGTHSWAAKEELTVTAGNAGGVMIAVNGDEAQPMGEPGSVEEQTFVADSRSANRPTGATSSSP